MRECPIWKARSERRKLRKAAARAMARWGREYHEKQRGYFFARRSPPPEYLGERRASGT